MTFALPGFDLDTFVRNTLAEDLGVGLPGGGKDVTSQSVIPADARFAGVMDSRDAIVVAGLPLGRPRPRFGPAETLLAGARRAAPRARPAPGPLGAAPLR